MATELNALLQNQTQVLLPPPSNQHVIDCKWVFRIKRKSDGSIERYKARLVAKELSQKEGVDYTKAFNPVRKPVSYHSSSTHNCFIKWVVRQLDVNNVFLHGELEETVYMQQPPGFMDPSTPQHVCLLKKDIYGLKQEPRACFNKLKNCLRLPKL